MTVSKNAVKAVDSNNAIARMVAAMLLAEGKTGLPRNSGKSVSSKDLKSF
jgi:hypothetical protein